MGALLLLVAVATAGCRGSQAGAVRPASGTSAREAAVERAVAGALADLPAAGTVAVAVLDPLGNDAVLRDADRSFHAASTMKVAVLLELHRGADAGRWSLADSVLLENRFRSIVDGSPYALDPADDSDSLAYELVGARVSLDWLAERMITVSSNLATNRLVEVVDPDSVNAALARVGAEGMRVLRGVEDTPAFERGLNNTTTAEGFARLLAAIAAAEAGRRQPGISPAAGAEMAARLSRQAFREGIPAGVPPGIRVAHKTGSITGIEHDGGIVYPPAGEPFVLVVLTEGFADPAAAHAAIAGTARAVWDAWTSASTR